jgi:hypothetical protein
MVTKISNQQLHLWQQESLNPMKEIWKKLIKMINFLKATNNNIATMSADDSNSIKWYVNASFAVHKDMRSHIGATMTLGSGVICSISTKQRSIPTVLQKRSWWVLMMWYRKYYG